MKTKTILISLVIQTCLITSLFSQRNFDSPDFKQEYLDLTELIKSHLDSAELYYVRSEKIYILVFRFYGEKALGITYDDAIKDISKAIDLDKNVAKYYDRRATLLLNIKDDKAQGITDLTQAIELEPENGDWYNSRADLYYRNGENDKACVDWKKGAEFGHLPCKRAIQTFCR